MSRYLVTVDSAQWAGKGSQSILNRSAMGYQWVGKKTQTEGASMSGFCAGEKRA